MVTTPLAEYLRSRRALVMPQLHGLADHGARRVRGLRREEVAVLAGVSVDYYVRLEQGRERSPSGQVVQALGRALDLDGDGVLHLHRLAGRAPLHAPPPAPERVDPDLSRLLDSWTGSPALVLGRAFDVLATNPLAEALFGGFPRSRNLTEATFLDPAARTFYVDWDEVATNTVAGLRLAEGAAPDEPRLRQVVDRLLVTSPDFARMWRRHDARSRRLEVKRLLHPEVGLLALRIHAFDVRAAPGQELVVYSAEPGSPSARAVARLATAATAER